MTELRVPSDEVELERAAREAVAALRETRKERTAMELLERENEGVILRAMNGRRVGLVDGKPVVVVESRWDIPLDNEPEFFGELMQRFRSHPDYCQVRLVKP